jgi:hypothetical protein
MSSDFAAPAAPGGDKLPLADLLGALLMFEVLEERNGIATAFGTSDAIVANVHVLDGPLKGGRYDDSLVFPKVLAGQLRPRVGSKVLGRLGHGVAKPGQSAPWVLSEATDDDKAVAKRYVDHLATQAAVVEEPW